MDPRRFRPALAAAAVVLAFACPAAARGDAVTDWNSHANAAIFSAGPPAHSAVLSTAMVQGAVYDAVNAIAGGYEDYLPTPRAHRWYSQDAAAATAAFHVVRALVADPVQLSILQGHYDASLGAIRRRAREGRRDRRRRGGGRRDARASGRATAGAARSGSCPAARRARGGRRRRCSFRTAPRGSAT